MDHDEVREQLELAAVEPGGIDRLMAGDTPLAAAVAGHLVDCPSCTEELTRLRRAAIVIGDAVRTTPPPELRERTLTFVREFGRMPAAAGAAAPGAAAPGAAAPGAVVPGAAAPGAAAPGAVVPGAAAAPGTAPSPDTAVEPLAPVAVAPRSGGGARRLAWVAALAAAIVVSVAATTLVLDRQFSDRLAAAEAGAAGLSRVTAETLALSGEPDAERVDLAGSDDVWGTLVYSPSKSSLAVIASGLTEPSSDLEYRCWVEIDGQRTPVGKMFFGGDLAFWAGHVDAVDDLPPGATFGVSLVDAAGTDLGGPAVLAGAVE
jgi:hypothetical protein